MKKITSILNLALKHLQWQIEEKSVWDSFLARRMCRYLEAQLQAEMKLWY
jgi:hypothetical protein